MHKCCQYANRLFQLIAEFPYQNPVVIDRQPMKRKLSIIPIAHCFATFQTNCINRIGNATDRMRPLLNL